MQFEITNFAGDRLRIEIRPGMFKLGEGIELEAIPSSPQLLTDEKLRAARDAEWRTEQDSLIEHRRCLFSRLPKRGRLDGSEIQWEFWNGQQWQPYELPPPPFFFALTDIPDPDAPDFKRPPG